MWQDQLCSVSVIEHQIDLEPGYCPVRLPPYRAGHKDREVEKTEVDEIFSWISSNRRRWSSPVVIVPKHDGRLRYCVDYRRLNAWSLEDSCPLH